MDPTYKQLNLPHLLTQLKQLEMVQTEANAKPSPREKEIFDMLQVEKHKRDVRLQRLKSIQKYLGLNKRPAQKDGTTQAVGRAELITQLEAFRKYLVLKHPSKATSHVVSPHQSESYLGSNRSQQPHFDVYGQDPADEYNWQSEFDFDFWRKLSSEYIGRANEVVEQFGVHRQTQSVEDILKLLIPTKPKKRIYLHSQPQEERYDEFFQQQLDEMGNVAVTQVQSEDTKVTTEHRLKETLKKLGIHIHKNRPINRKEIDKLYDQPMRPVRMESRKVRSTHHPKLKVSSMMEERLSLLYPKKVTRYSNIPSRHSSLQTTMLSRQYETTKSTPVMPEMHIANVRGKFQQLRGQLHSMHSKEFVKEGTATIHQLNRLVRENQERYSPQFDLMVIK